MFCSLPWQSKPTVNPGVGIFSICSGTGQCAGWAESWFSKGPDLPRKSSTVDSHSPPVCSPSYMQRKEAKFRLPPHVSPQRWDRTVPSPSSVAAHTHTELAPLRASATAACPPWVWGQPAEGTGRPQHPVPAAPRAQVLLDWDILGGKPFPYHPI